MNESLRCESMETLFQQTCSDDFDFEGECLEARVLGGLFDLPVRGPTIGRFEIRERLGSGGMGEVYAAWDPELYRMVAIKLDHVGRRRPEQLLREARVHAQVESPYVLPIYDVGVHGERVYMAMKIVHGRTLATWQRDNRSLHDILSAYTRAARGLAEIHRSGIVHCDFKPANVLVDADERIWITDFGLARFCADFGAGGGTHRYMAPERMFDDFCSPASDQFSFCVSLFEAIHGALPFPGSGECGEVVLPPDAREIPGGLAAVLERGLRRDPGQRFPNMTALIDALVR